MNISLFKPIKTKLDKTKQTRGADDDVIYQNRVKRNSTVLIPFRDYDLCSVYPYNEHEYENGFIVLIKPEDYFEGNYKTYLASKGLALGKNLLVFYETREQWKNYPVPKNWKPANSRISPLGGQYIARIPATTAKNEHKIIKGYNTAKLKGAGIRVYEYADNKTIEDCRIQLEYVFWKCFDIDIFLQQCSKEEREELIKRKEKVVKLAVEGGLADTNKLVSARIINSDGVTICPLCLKPISALGFASKMVQAEGRDVPDLTVTNVSLFHIKELRTGEFNHRLYNLGWGHYHCNVTTADMGVQGTLKWMKDILSANRMI